MNSKLVTQKGTQDLDISSWLHHLRILTPPSGVIVVGAGMGGWANLLTDLEVPLAYFIEADAERYKHLQGLLSSHGQWQALHAFVAKQSGEATYYQASLSFESGLLSPASLARAWPNIKENAQEIRETCTLTQVLQDINHPTQPNWLVVDCLPALPILQGLGTGLENMDVLVVRAIVNQDDFHRISHENIEHDGVQLTTSFTHRRQYSQAMARNTPSVLELARVLTEDLDGTGATLSEVESWLIDNGFRCLWVQEERNPTLINGLFIRDNNAALNAQRQQAVEIDAEHKRQLQQARQDAEQTKTELVQHTVELQAQIRRLSAAKAQAAQQASDARNQLEQATAAQAAAEELAAGLQQQLELARQDAEHTKAELGQQIERLHVQINQLSMTHAQAEQQAAESRNQLEEASQAQAAATQLATRLQKQLVQARQDVEQAKRDLAQQNEEHQAQLEQLGAAKAKATQQAAELQDQLQEANQAQATAEQVAVELERQLEQARQDAEQTKTTLTQQTAQIQAAAEEHAESITAGLKSGGGRNNILSAGSIMNMERADEVKAQFIALNNASSLPLKKALHAWREGAWHKLVKFDNADLAEHADRAMLAVFAGAAYHQIDDKDGLERCMRRALSWGMEPEIIKYFLVSGVNNTLATCDALIGDYETAASRFGQAVSIGDVAVEPAAIMDRANGQLKRMKISEAADILKSIENLVYKHGQNNDIL